MQVSFMIQDKNILLVKNAVKIWEEFNAVNKQLANHIKFTEDGFIPKDKTYNDKQNWEVKGNLLVYTGSRLPMIAHPLFVLTGIRPPTYDSRVLHGRFHELDDEMRTKIIKSVVVESYTSPRTLEGQSRPTWKWYECLEDLIDVDRDAALESLMLTINEGVITFKDIQQYAEGLTYRPGNEPIPGPIADVIKCVYEMYIYGILSAVKKFGDDTIVRALEILTILRDKEQGIEENTCKKQDDSIHGKSTVTLTTKYLAGIINDKVFFKNIDGVSNRPVPVFSDGKHHHLNVNYISYNKGGSDVYLTTEDRLIVDLGNLPMEVMIYFPTEKGDLNILEKVYRRATLDTWLLAV